MRSEVRLGGSGNGATSHRGLVGLVGLVLAVALAATACTPDGQAPPQQPVAGPVIVRIAVYGPAEVVRAYTRIAAEFSASHRAIAVSVKSYPDHDTALAATRRSIRAGNGPSLFLADRTDLPALLDGGLTMPVDELLGARHVDFGDGYARNALEAFSEQAALQCMPTQLSPLVVYYNTRLVDLAAAQGPAADPITADDGWTFEQFARAARRAAHAGHHGAWIAPDVEQLAPFVDSAGGHVVDDAEDPTEVTLSTSAAATALRKVGHLLRQPGVAPDPTELRRRDAVERFESGDLAMLLGYRDLTPELRRHRDLSFDVLPVPTIRSAATVGQMQGVCMTRTVSTTVSDAAADFLAYLVSDGPAALLARTGWVLPTNLEVESSPAFLQPGSLPATADVFVSQVRRIQLLPNGNRWEAAAAVVNQGLPDIFSSPAPGMLQSRLAALDAAATAVLTPPSPSSSPSSSPPSSPSSSPPSPSETASDG